MIGYKFWKSNHLNVNGFRIIIIISSCKRSINKPPQIVINEPASGFRIAAWCGLPPQPPNQLHIVVPTPGIRPRNSTPQAETNGRADRFTSMLLPSTETTTIKRSRGPKNHHYRFGPERNLEGMRASHLVFDKQQRCSLASDYGHEFIKTSPEEVGKPCIYHKVEHITLPNG